MEVLLTVLIALFIFGISIGYLLLSILITENRKLKSYQHKTLQEYLELATMDQFFEEIKNRETPLIIIKTSTNGLLVDCFNIPPALSISILESSADLVRNKIKKEMEDL